MAIVIQTLNEISETQRDVTIVLNGKIQFSGVIFDPDLERFYNYTVDKVSFEDSETDYDYGIIIDIVDYF